jgi:ribonuclease P protein component
MAASASSNESRLHTDESRLSPDESRLTLNKDNPDSSTANSHTQIGVVVPGKLGKAHARNKAKRQIRAVFKRNFDKIPDNQIISYILWDIDFEFDQLETDIKNLINKLRTP